ncbi:UNVERIFIED_ORG: hypothetical protein JN05_05278 [Zoogloea ramigera]|uniref:Dinitrogenase iron-molybdenum cofactor biosynthesis domain-containing protein n=1 Tax=Duganella zoogloeoides TaxID=75659 RepID=A0ABZ0Y118_9BURK|nr:hypothetical protein [Duganella zoogloeoides]WQH05418.1 hypothetical protein SR858_03510 [Duganella zoogloeoides]
MDTLPPTGEVDNSAPDSSAFSFFNLVLLMPHLALTSKSEIDYAGSDPALLVQLADAADAVLLITHMGSSAIGRLLAQAGIEPLSDAAVADSIEALGWLVAELNDMAGAVHRISAACRRHTYDYAPDAITTISLARP